MKRREWHADDHERIQRALRNLLFALKELKLAGARKTAQRVRLAISSCKGAVRHASGRAE